MGKESHKSSLEIFSGNYLSMTSLLPQKVKIIKMAPSKKTYSQNRKPVLFKYTEIVVSKKYDYGKIKYFKTCRYRFHA